MSNHPLLPSVFSFSFLHRFFMRRGNSQPPVHPRLFPKLRSLPLKQALALGLLVLATCGAARGAVPAAPVVEQAGTTGPLSLPSGVTGYSGASATPAITWNQDQGVDGFYVAVYDRTLYALVTPWFAWTSNSFTAGSTGCPVPELSTSHTYGVCVTAHNADGWGNWSDWMNFVVGARAAPAAPVVTQPGALESEISYYVVGSAYPTVEWAPATGAVIYWVSVFDLTVWAPVYEDYLRVDAPATSWTPDQPLLPSHIYKVIVGASNDYGTTWALDWRTFVVTPGTPPDKPVITSPKGDIKNPQPAFAWTSVDGAVAYVLSVYDMIESQTVFYDWVSGSGAVPVTFTDGHSYRARVIAHNDFGWGEWSDPANFTIDTTAPWVCPPGTVYEKASSANSAVVFYPPATAFDAVTPNPTLTYDPESGTMFSLGTTPVTVSATDEAGNTGTAAFNVIVVPAVTYDVVTPDDMTVEATGSYGACVSFPFDPYVANPNAASPLTPTLIYSHGSGASFPLGSTTVTITAIDEVGNTGASSFRVTVEDTTPPWLPAQYVAPTFTSSYTVYEGIDPGGAALYFSPADVPFSDNVTAVPRVAFDGPAGNFFPEGTTPVFVTATDDAGNTSVPCLYAYVVITRYAILAPYVPVHDPDTWPLDNGWIEFMVMNSWDNYSFAAGFPPGDLSYSTYLPDPNVVIPVLPGQPQPLAVKLGCHIHPLHPNWSGTTVANYTWSTGSSSGTFGVAGYPGYISQCWDDNARGFLSQGANAVTFSGDGGEAGFTANLNPMDLFFEVASGDEHLGYLGRKGVVVPYNGSVGAWVPVGLHVVNPDSAGTNTVTFSSDTYNVQISLTPDGSAPVAGTCSLAALGLGGSGGVTLYVSGGGILSATYSYTAANPYWVFSVTDSVDCMCQVAVLGIGSSGANQAVMQVNDGFAEANPGDANPQPDNDNNTMADYDGRLVISDRLLPITPYLTLGIPDRAYDHAHFQQSGDGSVRVFAVQTSGAVGVSKEVLAPGTGQGLDIASYLDCQGANWPAAFYVEGVGVGQVTLSLVYSHNGYEAKGSVTLNLIKMEWLTEANQDTDEGAMFPPEDDEEFAQGADEPGGVGGFGGPHADSGFANFQDAFQITDLVFGAPGNDGRSSISCTMASTVSNVPTNGLDGTNSFTMTQLTANSAGFVTDNGVLGVMPQGTPQGATGQPRSFQAVIVNVIFGYMGTKTLYETGVGTDTYMTRHLQIVATLDALPNANTIQTMQATLTSDVVGPNGDLTTGAVTLTETGAATSDFKSADGKFEVRIDRITAKGAASPNDFTATVWSELLGVTSEGIDAVESGNGTLVFRTDLTHNDDQPPPTIGSGGAAFRQLYHISLTQAGGHVLSANDEVKFHEFTPCNLTFTLKATATPGTFIVTCGESDKFVFNYANQGETPSIDIKRAHGNNPGIIAIRGKPGDTYTAYLVKNFEIEARITLLGLDFIDSKNGIISPMTKALNVSNFRPTDMSATGAGYADTSADPDNFRLQVTDKDSSLSPNVVLTNKTQNYQYALSAKGTGSKGYTEWRSNFLRLVANADDQAALAADDNQADPTRNRAILVALGDRIDISYAGKETVTRHITVGRLVDDKGNPLDGKPKNNDCPCQLRHEIRELKVRFLVIRSANNQLLMDRQHVDDMVKATNEILAQATIRLKTDTDSVVDVGTVAITNGAFVAFDPDPTRWWKVTDDMRTLWAKRPANAGDTVDVFIVGGLSRDMYAYSFNAYWVTSSRSNDPGNANDASNGLNSICLTAGDGSDTRFRGQVLAHELGHILMNQGTHILVPPYNLMHDFATLQPQDAPLARRIKPCDQDELRPDMETSKMRAGVDSLPQP